MATVPELKRQADSLGVKYPSKIRKADLESLIAEATRKPAVRVTAPLPNTIRSGYYGRQRNGGKRTPAQCRRMRKHDNRAKGRA